MRDTDEIDRLFKIIEDMMAGNFPMGGYMSNNSKIEVNDRGIDISEDEDNIYITMELKGITDSDLKVTPSEDSISLEMMMDGSWRKRTIKLSAKVDPKSAKITFNNCILDVTLKKVKENAEEKKDGL